MSLPLSGPFDTGQLPRLAPHPVTVTVARTIAPGWEAEFLRWADELVDAVREFPGCLGAAVLHPGADGGEYQIIVRFSDGMMLRDVGALADSQRVDGSFRPVRHRYADAAHGRRRGVVQRRRSAPNPSGRCGRSCRSTSPGSIRRRCSSRSFLAPLLVKIPLGFRVLTSIAVVTVVMQFVVMPIRKRIRSHRRF